MQARHADGRTFAKGEYDTYVSVEQMTCCVMADAFLLQWLNKHKAIGLYRPTRWYTPARSGRCKFTPAQVDSHFRTVDLQGEGPKALIW